MKKICGVLSVFLSVLLLIQSLPLSAGALSMLSDAEASELSVDSSVSEPLESVRILEEDISRREENVKHFKMSDGTYRAEVYSTPVHYLENGLWKEIDSSIKRVSDSKRSAGYAAHVSGTDFYFPDKLNSGEKLEIRKNGHKLSFSYIQNELSLFSSSEIIEPEASLTKKSELADSQKIENRDEFSVRSGGLRYANVSGSTDIEYELNSSMLKESIIVSSRKSEYIYRFSVDIGELVPVENDGGSISLVDPKNENKEEYIISAPFMFDAKGLFSNAVTMKLEQAENGYILTVEADKEWLNSSERAFPVTIDPTILYEPDKVNDIFDTYVDSGTPDVNHYLSTYSIVGYNSLGTGRAFIKFNLPELTHCGVIVNATLGLIQMGYDPGNGVTNYMAVYESPQTNQTYQTLTWNNHPSLDSQPIIDYTVFKAGTNASVFYTLDITKIAKKWFEEGTNNGLYLKSVNEGSSWRSTIYTSNYTGYDLYPMVSISYIDNVGLEDYWSYETLDLGRSGGAYINQYNGLLTYVHQDINLGGNITYLSAAHNYSNNYGAAAPYGYGFRLSAEETITLVSNNSILNDTENTYKAYYTDADGTAHYFKYRTDNEWYFEFDDNLILAVLSSGYELRFEDGSKKVFNSDGRLTKIIDRNGNTITQSYDSLGRVTMITDAVGRSITYNYSGDYLASSTDHAERVTTYTYSGGYLTAINYPDGKSTVFTYSANRLQNIKKADGENVSFSYTSSDRVSTVFVKGTDLSTLKSCNFEYTGSNTIITDSQGRRLTVGFDNAGRAVSYMDNDGNVSETRYNSAGNKNNTVAAQSDMFSFSNNLLKNHSFENGFSEWGIYMPSGSYSVSNEYDYIGSSSLKLTRSVNGSIFAYQDVWYMSIGKSYTFSVYIKAKNLSNCRVGIHIEGRSTIAELISYSDNYIEINSEGEWIRLQVQYTVPSGVAFLRPIIYLEGDSGTAYFDAAQLEETSSAGHYNLLENPGFDRYSSNSFRYWNTPANAYAVNNQLNDSQSAAIDGSITEEIRIWQQVNIGTSTKERTLIFGGISKGECAPKSNAGGGPRYCLVLEMFAGSTLVQSVVADYNAYASDTAQIIFNSAAVGTNITMIRLHILYDWNVNTAYFDDFFIYMDNYGTRYQYDADGKLLMSSNNAGDAISYTYNGIDISKISVTKDGEETDSCQYEYDAKHNITKETTKSGIVTEYTYPASNKGVPDTVVVKNANGTLQSNVSYTYVLFSNYTRYVTDARGKTQEYYYDSARDLLLSYTDENGNETEYEYDEDNDELLRVYTTVDGVTLDVNYSYDTNGRLSSVSQSGVSYGFSYDVFGRRTATRVGTQTLASYSYNSRGLLSTTTYGNGTVHSLSYDESDRLVSEAYNGTTAYTYSYNTEGYLGKTTDIPLGITTYYNYDLVGRVKDVDSSDGLSSHFTFNEYNAIESYSVKKNGVEISDADYYYDEDGLLSEIYTDYANYEYTYDSLNRVTRKSHYLGGIPVRTNYTYLAGSGSNTTGLVSSISYTDNGIAKLPQLSYTYDNKGNILTVSQNGVLNNSYTYDELDRLVRENNKDLNQTITYTYDTRGNILKKEYYDYTTGTLGNVVDTINYTYDSTWKDKLYSYDGESITYDSIGNPTTYRGDSLTWEKGRQLKSIGNISFKYNIDGLRTEKKAGSTTISYIWSSGLLIQQSDGTNTLKFIYAPDGTALSVNYNGSYYFYLYNLQGDVVALYNTIGTVVVKYTYDSWGKLISTTGSLASTLGKLNPFRYRGYVYDEETGLYYISSRYYDPEIGRFINADAAYDTNQGVLGYNMYVYCLNNPVNMYDPDGRCSRFLGFLWKIDCKQASCPESKNYINPKTVAPIGTYNKGQGYVYIVKEDIFDEIMDDKEDNVVVILDNRSASDPNMQIQDSYRITKNKQQKEIAQLMLDYNTSNPVEPAWSRTLDSMVKEWKLHNFAYNLGYKQERTGDCDFNNADEGMGFWDFVGR